MSHRRANGTESIEPGRSALIAQSKGVTCLVHNSGEKPIYIRKTDRAFKVSARPLVTYGAKRI